MPIDTASFSVDRNSFLLPQVPSLIEMKGTGHPIQAAEDKHADINKRKAVSQNRENAKRFKSNYEWRGASFVANILVKNANLAAKFPHLSGRPPD